MPSKLSIILSILILSLISSSTGLEAIAVQAQSYDNPILIYSDADFQNYGLPGSGTAEDPYIIEDLHIKSSSSTYLIHIRNTRSYYIIRHNTLDGNHTANQGIFVIDAPNGQILNNTVFNTNQFGIQVANTENVNVSDNTVHDSLLEGIIIYEARNIGVTNNDVFSNTENSGWAEIFCIRSENVAIEANKAYNGQANGIASAGCIYTEINKNEVFSNNFVGLRIQERSAFLKMTQNVLYHLGESGIDISEDSHSNIVEFNDLKGPQEGNP